MAGRGAGGRGAGPRHFQRWTKYAETGHGGDVALKSRDPSDSQISRAPHDVLADYIDAVELVAPVETLRVVAADPDGDHVIAAAIAAEADLIVSGDHDLLRLGSHRNIRVVTPAEAIRLLG